MLYDKLTAQKSCLQLAGRVGRVGYYLVGMVHATQAARSFQLVSTATIVATANTADTAPDSGCVQALAPGPYSVWEHATSQKGLLGS